MVFPGSLIVPIEHNTRTFPKAPANHEIMVSRFQGLCLALSLAVDPTARRCWVELKLSQLNPKPKTLSPKNLRPETPNP